jgi:hypothetical protein
MYNILTYYIVKTVNGGFDLLEALPEGNGKVREVLRIVRYFEYFAFALITN